MVLCLVAVAGGLGVWLQGHPKQSGTIEGDLVGGCFGFGGPPDQELVTIRAVRHGTVVASEVLDVRKSNSNGGPSYLLGTHYVLTVPRGTYDVLAFGPDYSNVNLGGWEQGPPVVVANGEIATEPDYGNTC